MVTALEFVKDFFFFLEEKLNKILLFYYTYMGFA